MRFVLSHSQKFSLVSGTRKADHEISQNSRVEPPRKRRKTATGKRAVEHQDRNQAGPQHQYIVVKESLLEIRCAGSKLSGFDLTLRKNNISYSSPWSRHASSYSAHSLDIYDEAGNSLL